MKHRKLIFTSSPPSLPSLSLFPFFRAVLSFFLMGSGVMLTMALLPAYVLLGNVLDAEVAFTALGTYTYYVSAYCDCVVLGYALNCVPM
jgi:hypothetical protein